MSLGAVFEPASAGTRFWAWAPSVSNGGSVAVLIRKPGDAAWQPPRALASAGGGWQTFVPGVVPGDQYALVLDDGHGKTRTCLDPEAEDTIHSSLLPGPNAGIVVDPSGTPWVDFRTPAFENLIVYQLHVGAFSGRGDHCTTWPATFRDVETKLDYVRAMGFNALELLPVNEFCLDRSWGYNPAFFFAVESSYGSPEDLRHLVNEAHRRGLAVIFDVVYNHAALEDNSLWGWDLQSDEGLYLQRYQTPWGNAPAYWRDEVKAFFLENAELYLRDYRGDGLRFDATREIEKARGWNDDGWRFLQHLTWFLKERFSDKYLVAEHLPDHDSIVRSAGFHATWHSAAHHEFQRAASGDDPVRRLARILGKDLGEGRAYPEAWNLVKYLLGSHDDCGDDKDGSTLNDPDDTARHRYFVEHFGGRENGWARAKARMGWALNVSAMGTPMLFMGNECHMWGYWNDGEDHHGDHRFAWQIAGDPLGMEMRRLVTAANEVRWSNPCLRGEYLEITHQDTDNSVIAFKRWLPGQPGAVLVVVNCSDHTFSDHGYGVATGGQGGQWTQILCTQDDAFGGRDGAGNAYHEPWTQSDGKVYLNVPQWSVVMMRLLA